MKECNYGKIPPCYGKLIAKLRNKLMEGGFLDDTHYKVYGVNKQMCDLGIPLRNPIEPISEETLIGKYEKIGKEWASKNKEIVESIFGNITNEKSNIMEKKTKKMTKAEAFEYLKDAKIYVDRQIEAVLEKLFKIGLTWRDGGQTVDLGWSSDDEVYGLIIGDGKLSWVDKPCCGSWFDNLAMPRELRADDVLSMEIVEGTPKFSYEKVVELAKPLMEYLNETGWMEQIGVSYDHIVAQPMAIFLHGEIKGC